MYTEPYTAALPAKRIFLSTVLGPSQVQSVSLCFLRYGIRSFLQLGSYPVYNVIRSIAEIPEVPLYGDSPGNAGVYGVLNTAVSVFLRAAQNDRQLGLVILVQQETDRYISGSGQTGIAENAQVRETIGQGLEEIFLGRTLEAVAILRGGTGRGAGNCVSLHRGALGLLRLLRLLGLLGLLSGVVASLKLVCNRGNSLNSLLYFFQKIEQSHIGTSFFVYSTIGCGENQDSRMGLIVKSIKN